MGRQIIHKVIDTQPCYREADGILEIAGVGAVALCEHHARMVMDEVGRHLDDGQEQDDGDAPT